MWKLLKTLYSVQKPIVQVKSGTTVDEVLKHFIDYEQKNTEDLGIPQETVTEEKISEKLQIASNENWKNKKHSSKRRSKKIKPNSHGTIYKSLGLRNPKYAKYQTVISDLDRDFKLQLSEFGTVETA